MNETMLEEQQRQSVIDEAMTWLRTPHHNMSRLKGVGVDCGQFPIAVYSACGLMPDIKPERYAHDFHLHQNKEWYLSLAQSNGREFSGPPKKGDFVLYKIGRVFSHGAIVVEWPDVIHAAVGIGVILDKGNQGFLASRHIKAVKFFTLWGQ